MVVVTQNKPIFKWQPSIGMLLFAVFFLPVTLFLGFWQLDRAEEKRALLAEYHARKDATPVQLAALGAGGEHQYRRVLASGHFVEDATVLLENRVRDGKPGYEVLSAFEGVPGQPWLWVNRGWIQGAYDRSVLPEIPHEEGALTLRGHLYRSEEKPFTVGEETWREQWPQVFQNADMELLSERLGKGFFPYVLRLDEDSSAALQAGWSIVNVMPEKHTGYAVQWFFLAAALVILSLFANSNLGAVIKGRHSKSNSGS